MESTAALIPFDRLFKFSADELTDEYRVNLFKKVKEENAELLGMFGEEDDKAVEYASEKVKGSDSEAEDSGNDQEQEQEEEEVHEKSSNGESAKKSKKNKKVSRKMRELEYDYDDPFIDDSEITDVYQSVFELMRGGGGSGEAGDSENDLESNPNERANVKTKERNFFVYRGTMTPEILSKEFEIDVEELLEGEGAANDEEIEREEKKKRKTSSGGNGAAVKKPKTVKPEKEPKKPKVKEPKEPKKKKPSDFIAQSSKKFNDLFSSEDVNEKNEKTEKIISTPVFNVNGVDSNLLEFREVLKRFRDAAVGTPFSPGKFPSALRPRLNESICSVLRICRPAPTALFPPKLFPALASFLPFSPAALNKLLTKKILGPLMEGIEKNDLPKMYENWRKLIEKRIIEGGFIEVPVAPAVNSIVNNTTVAGTVTAEDQIDKPIAEATAEVLPSSPVKKRLKFNDEMRQKVFEIVRMEIDLNNLFCLSNFSAAASSNENASAISLRSVQSELNLRKIVYQKLMNLSVETSEQGGGGVPLLSTTEISKEFGAQKRKHEKKVSKAASEILFGEAEVEDLLKELDVRKETANIQVQQVQQEQSQLPMDPLNLFTSDAPVNLPASVVNDQSNTSLFIESNQ